MKKLLLALFIVLMPSLAFAQNNARNPCYYLSPTDTHCQPVSPQTPLPVLATVSASVSGFTPSGSFAVLTAAGTSGSVALPTNGGTVAFQNTGTTTVSCTLGVGSATAVVNQIQVPANSTVSVSVGSNTFAACIDQSGTASNPIVLAGGSGLGSSFGGGSSGGGGGGGAVTNAGVFAVQVTSAPTTAVTGTFWQATQPVSGTFFQATQPVSIASAVAVTGTFFQATQPVSATALPLPALAATSTIQATQQTSLTAMAAQSGTTVDAPCTVPTTATACTETALLKAIANVANGPATFASQYPAGAVPITASATGTTAATTATLAAASGKTTYICGYSIRGNATANTNVTNTLTGVVTATMSSLMWVPANTAGLGIDEQIFSPCIPASAVNTAINAVSGAMGTGGLVTSKAWGYQL